MPKYGRGYTWDKKKKRWSIRFQLNDGRSYRESLGSEWKEKQVVEHIANIRRKDVLGKLGYKDRLISDALEYYLERAEQFKGYEKLSSHVRAIYPWIKGKRLSEIAEIARNYRAFHQKKLSGATINRRVALLRRVIRVACKELGWVDRVPFFYMAAEKSRTTHLSMQEVEALVAATNHQPTKDAILIAVCTGWRQSEIWSLTQDNIRYGTLYISDSKNGQPRISPIHDRIAAAVTRLPFNVHVRTMFRYFKEAAAKIGMPTLRYHDLRHTTASLIINAGGTLKDVQEILGHKSVATSNRYSHLIVERKRTVLDFALKAVETEDKKEGAA